MRSCLNTNSDSILSRFRAGRKDLLGPGLNPNPVLPHRGFHPLLEPVWPLETLLLLLLRSLQEDGKRRLEHQLWNGP